MKIFNSIQEFKSDAKTIVTLGTFDGVHLGHKSILEKITKSSNSEYKSVVLTFFPHPRMVLQQNSDIKLLNTIQEKALLLEKCGIDNLIIHPFDQEFSRLSAEEFVTEILVKQLNLKKIVIGYDHRFGRNRTATIDDLILFGKKLNFEVEQITAREIDEVAISSTKIRTALSNGNIEIANQFLGYNYFISGSVVEGKKLGRTINFPTANIKIEEDYKLIPQNGVYIASAIIEGKTVFGMMNIGNNPTVGSNKQSIEINFFNFNGNLYNKNLQISIYKKIRDEIKFPSVEALRTQLEKDKIVSTEYLKTKK